MLRLEDLFEGQKELRLARHPITVLIDESHSRIGLLLVNPVGAASESKDVIEEEVKLIGIKGARVVSIVSGEDLIDVLLQLIIVDHVNFILALRL
jgi:hypothetical protein